MRPDYLSSKRAMGVSFLGVAIHAALGTALVAHGVLKNDHAGLTLGLLVWIGLVAWLVLAIVYDQSRRERAEAIEAEAFRAQGISTSVFEGSGDEFRVAAKRLNTMYRVFFPVMSTLIGAALVGVGVWRFMSGVQRAEPANFPPQTDRGWALGLYFIVAVTGFVFARYTSGMARQGAWANLRAGASFAVGASVFATALIVGHFVDFVGPDTLLRWLQPALAAGMVVMGAEVFLLLLLEVYRPRKAGETPRPSFDSRLLGFVASPDTVAKSVAGAINYQLGYEVSGTWFYQLLSRTLVVLVGFGLLVAWGLTAITVIEPHQRGMVLRFGKKVGGELEPGLHFKLPWPIDEVLIPEYVQTDAGGRVTGRAKTVTGVRLLQLGTLPSATPGAVLWTNDHGREEVNQIMQPARGGAGPAGGIAGGGAGGAQQIAVLSMEIPLQYSVSDVEKFEELGAAEVRDDILRLTAQREVIRYLAQFSTDDILGPRRVEMVRALEDRISAAFAKLNPGADGVARGAGVKVLSLGIAGVHPPKDVAPQFEKVVQAEQNRQAKIERARATAIEAVTKVVGSVALAEQIVGEIDALERLRQGARETDPATQRALNDQEQKIQELLGKAEGAAAAEIARAGAERWARHMDARARGVRYEGQLAAYTAAPDIFKTSLYFDTLKEVLPKARVYVTSDRAADLRIEFDGADTDTGIAAWRNLDAEPQ